jgi:hypothetical protein
LKERIRGRVADALDPLATRIARRPARRSKTTCKRPGENFTFSGQFSFLPFRGDAVTRVAFSVWSNRLACGLEGSLRPSTILRKGW